MGKMKKFMKHHGYGHRLGAFPMHAFGPRFPTQNATDNSDSDSNHCHGKPWKHFKKMHKLRHLMHHMDDNTVCSLCAHQLKAGTDIEMMQCGHLYHRECIKQLITLMAITQDDVLCTRCTQKVEQQVLDAFKARLAIQTVVNDANIAATDMENLTI